MMGQDSGHLAFSSTISSQETLTVSEMVRAGPPKVSVSPGGRSLIVYVPDFNPDGLTVTVTAPLLKTKS